MIVDLFIDMETEGVFAVEVSDGIEKEMWRRKGKEYCGVKLGKTRT